MFFLESSFISKFTTHRRYSRIWHLWDHVLRDQIMPCSVVQNFFDLDDEPLELSRKSPTSTTTILVSPIQIHVLIGLDGDDLLDTVNLALGTNFLSVEHMWMLPRLEKYVPEYMTPIRSEVERYTELQWSE